MFTPSGWTVLVLRKMNIKWGAGFEDQVPVGEMEGFYTRLLWAIPEDEEDSATKDRNLIQLNRNSRKSSSFGSSSSRHFGRDCDCPCNADGLMKGAQARPKFASPIRQMRRNVRISNSWPALDSEFESSISSSSMKSTDDKYPAPLSFIPPRKRADEEELSYQCDEVSQLYSAVSQGKLSLDNLRILGLSLRI
ncbi:hypothetical protein MPTK1_2g24580 [Marchantia polymorpha subsp. ruderalis]|uniref:Uncharacterized protein n=1 Tax=Marchantia polymorpha TaxID=3197 RepID=A0A2R6VZU6_MARPO|nr:hypothetical protein MARPO_0221s0006 [Marchantia polymorpha]BBN03572.1 hypothetical protein Mp_2g24580 [Marchantia polymorpha subsp. ruderalis]|eukprot:PTQ27111.1 hypothetical protein MARPO_0221s0006 [Marchantia polymorpha]